ncbi:MAG: solute carrier family 26 protein [Actinomycetota bacterium]|nr:solute carrier family 26 protein [Actinomycetota bacterium]MDA3033842.1 solute carrier family 26 protein [Actinomycetota bacterium]
MSPLSLRRVLPITDWLGNYQRPDLRSDLAAGLTIAAMLIPQGMAYALLAGLPPEIGLYASTLPVLAYAIFGTSRQLAVGPVAIVSLLTASALSPLYEQGTTGYVSAAALLAIMVGLVHLVLGLGRLGFIVNFLSHSVLVGFTAAAAIIIGFSQVKHILGVNTDRKDHFYETVIDVVQALGDTHGTTLALGAGSIAGLLGIKRIAPRIPGALIIVVATTVIAASANLADDGVSTVGSIPDSLPAFGLPGISGGLVGDLAVTALVITMVGFMESIAVAKVYARRHRYEVEPNQELVALGMANVTSGVFGGYPVTGGFSRTAVNDTAGARTPLASIITALLVLVSIAFFTPLFTNLPKAALGAIIIVAVINLIDIAEMRHIATVKRSDTVGMGVAFVGTLAVGIELGILIAVVASMLVVFARMSRPHTAVLGRIPDTTSYRNIVRFPEAVQAAGVRIIRIDAALSFVNSQYVKRLLLAEADPSDGRRRVVLDCSGINDIDATGAETLSEIITEFAESPVELHLCDVKGPVRDVLHRSGLWDELGSRIHATPHQAVDGELVIDPRSSGIDERGVSV